MTNPGPSSHPRRGAQHPTVSGIVNDWWPDPPYSAAARQLLVSETTIKTHLLHIYTKLGVRDRASAVAAAYKRGLLG